MLLIAGQQHITQRGPIQVPKKRRPNAKGSGTKPVPDPDNHDSRIYWSLLFPPAEPEIWLFGPNCDLHQATLNEADDHQNQQNQANPEQGKPKCIGDSLDPL